MASRVPAGSHGVMPIFPTQCTLSSGTTPRRRLLTSIDPEKCNKATLFRALEENAAIVSACNLAQIRSSPG
ncbi:hypothetical protein EAO18_00070 [Klebsiella pneumoniae]|nr:hypothetical protein EAO18_00070 [Klebsiella pneumoniae]